MQCILILVVTALLCQMGIRAQNIHPRSEGYYDRTQNHHSPHGAPYMRPPWQHYSGPYDAFGINHAMRPTMGHFPTPADSYGVNPNWFSANRPIPPSTDKAINKADQIALCIRSCSVTTEYNPVCGSNNVTYTNPGRLECEQKCGVDVQLSRLSPCLAFVSNNQDYTVTIDVLIACIRECSMTTEYNPVCGSNNVTYVNPGRLMCEQNCGVPVELSKLSPCTGFEPPTTQRTEEQVSACIRLCPVTGEYNPVCGSDNVTYPNPGRLECAQNCGLVVSVSRQTSCSVPLTGDEINSVNKTRDNSFLNSSTTEVNLTPITNSNSTTARPFINGNGNDKLNWENTENGPNNNESNDANVIDNNQIVKNNLSGTNQGNSNGANNQRPPSVKEVMACMQLCSLSSEYNPVCGTDDITYTNPGRLLCAQFCGIDVRAKKFAPCTSTSNVNLYCPAICTNPPVTDNPGPITPSSPTTPTKPSFQACLDACPASGKFKPVCGNNNITYRNLEKIQCAIRCGVDVQVKNLSPCPYYESPSTATTTEKEPVSPGANSGLNFTISPDIIANIWPETTSPRDESDESYELDQRVKD